jgi:hypothetical protein
MTVLRCTKLFVFAACLIRHHEPATINSLTVVGSLDFQTRRLADDPRSAGQEAVPEVGLEICAATVRLAILLIT